MVALFRYQSPNEDDDVVDSDFSIDENDEVRSDLEDEEEGKKRSRRGQGVVTKAYREPPKKTQAEKEKDKKEKEARCDA